MRQTPQEVVILVREGAACASCLAWRQYMVVSDDRVAIVHMSPALFGGWKFDRVDIQRHADWLGWSRDSIVAFKFEGNDGLTRFAPDLGEFRAKLIERATGAL